MDTEAVMILAWLFAICPLLWLAFAWMAPDDLP